MSSRCLGDAEALRTRVVEPPEFEQSRESRRNRNSWENRFGPWENREVVSITSDSGSDARHFFTLVLSCGCI